MALLPFICGVLVVAQPANGALALVSLFGFYGILAGFSQISPCDDHGGWAKPPSPRQMCGPGVLSLISSVPDAII